MFSVHDIRNKSDNINGSNSSLYIKRSAQKKARHTEHTREKKIHYTTVPSFVELRGWKNETHEREIDAKCIVSYAMETMYSENVRGKKMWRVQGEQPRMRKIGRKKKQFHSPWQKHGIMCIIRSVEHTLPSTERKASYYKENQTYNTRTTIDS